MAQNDFLDKHVGNQLKGLKFDELIKKLNADVYGREMRNDISMSVQALGSAITELHDKGGSGSGVGWTDYQIGQLEKILKAAAYADTGIGDEINKLIASLRHIKVLTSLNVQPASVTLNAGDSLDSIKSTIHVYAFYDNNTSKEIYDYEIEGTLIQGKDCPVSVSYTEGSVTVTSTITATVRKRTPSKMTVRFFNDVDYLPIGTTSVEVEDAIYAQLIYEDGYREVIQDLLLDNKTVVSGKNIWTITSGLYPWIHADLEFYGTMRSSTGNARIVYLLEGCSSTNTVDEITPGTAFKTLISADHGSIDSLKVFIDGTDFTGVVAADGKTIDIQSIYVTMNGRIIISAIASTDYNITYHLTNCTSSNVDATISFGSVYQTYIQPNEGYELDLTEAKTYAMMGHQVFPAGSDGKIFIQNASDNIDVYGVAKPASGGEVTLSSISASYTGGTVAAGTTLDQLKNNLTVTAHYSDGSTATITDYSLSGTLTAGQTNVITVTYQGKTTTFNVTVEAEGSENPTIENGAFSFTYTYGATASADANELFTEAQIGTLAYGDIGPLLGRNHMITQTFPYLTTKKYVLNVRAIQYSAHVQFIAFDSGLNLIGYSPYGKNSYGACTTGTFDFTVQGGSLTNTSHSNDVWTIPDGTVYLAVFGRTRGTINSSNNMENGESKYLKFAMTVSDA